MYGKTSHLAFAPLRKAPDRPDRLPWPSPGRGQQLGPGRVQKGDCDAPFFTCLVLIEPVTQRLSVSIGRISDDEIEFDLVGVDSSVANAFRRILISEVCPFMCVSNASLILLSRSQPSLSRMSMSGQTPRSSKTRSLLSV
jgi:hypothetical protein